MPDDPREILNAAGVECAEVDAFEENKSRWRRHYYVDQTTVYNKADETVLALARLVAKYKWQRDECADELGRKLAVGYKYEATKPFAACDVIVDINQRWDEHNA